MPSKILTELKKKAGDTLEIYQSERIALDERVSPYADSYEHAPQSSFENPRRTGAAFPVREPMASIPTILRYFMDGSRRVYRVGDLVLGGSYYFPIVAGQVSVSVLERVEQSRLVPVRSVCRVNRVLALPDKIDSRAIAAFRSSLNATIGFPLQIVQYRTSEAPDKDPVEWGIAAIMRTMHDLEIEAVQELATQYRLNNDSWLVIDGPLRFKQLGASRRLDVLQFRNVIGVSKTFRPTFAVGRGRQAMRIGTLVAELDQAQRTSVFRAEHEDNLLGVWYLRLRKGCVEPLQGTVKVECYAIDETTRMRGFDSDSIETLSAHVFRERSETPYGRDWRWASHLYPIYSAETYAKSQFMSDEAFQALF